MEYVPGGFPFAVATTRGLFHAPAEMKGEVSSLCPAPRSVAPGGDPWEAGALSAVTLEGVGQESRRRLEQAVERLSREYQPETGQPFTLALTRRKDAPATEAYILDVRPGVIWVESGLSAGLFRGLQTLRQLLRAGKGRLPSARIHDAPVFAERGYLLDISRDKVPTMGTLLGLVDLLAEFKFNRFELYTEHTFAYRKHGVVWAGASPMTPEDIRTLDAFCRDRFIELVPNQNSFAHMERWLRCAAYRDLAECPNGCLSPWGPERRPPSMLNPLDPRSLALIADLYEELLPNFTSHKLNAGCDETYELGQGHSRAACEQHGRGRVYLDYLQGIHALAARHGRVLHYWADVVHEHPELMDELPRDAVAMEWGYEAAHDFTGRAARLASSGARFLVCPGTSSWNAVAGRTANAVGNLRAAAAAGLAKGAAGYVVTDWGDNGHWQPMPVSYVPMAIAATCAWVGGEGAADLEALLQAASIHAFGDRSGFAARAFAELGNVYLATGVHIANATLLFKLLAPHPQARWVEEAERVDWAAVSSAIESATRHWACATVRRSDADLLNAEFDFAVGLLRLACRRGRRENGAAAAAEARRLAAEHRRLWILRNRSGGLADSAARMDVLADALEHA